MPTKKQKVTGKKVKMKKAKKQQLSLAQQMSAVKAKFTELKRLRTQINKVKSLYARHDALMEELMPLFVEVGTDQFVINREIMIGNKKYRFNPFFYDEKKAQLIAKVWKSAAFPSGMIE